ncbi:Conserved hypothetical protein [Shewanella piezotolerans WP3]|uniref:DUF4412 domain-containing protein n=1 Tax=Shewanella piezotolerans (strain WP3 / JCM 13877) TaxID=225849 RepID=B8CJI5_SHEPW|nr:hypothetical protein [Shewanella piezotolerans]ACJ28082.1 Conserved hypothetical protein [Shewanella piezotolerans WP3]
MQYPLGSIALSTRTVLLLAGGLISQFFSSAVYATQCQSTESTIDASHLSARYVVSNSNGGNREITLLRNKQQLIYQHNPQSFELWDRRGEYVRYFPNERRSVSYRKGDLLSLNMHFNFEQLNHLISPATIKGLQQRPISKTNLLDTCITQQYSGDQSGHKLVVSWIDKLALPHSFVVSNANGSMQYQLVELTPFSNDEFSALISGYQDIDFADVGDNESDPFIAKMIHQGFIQHGSSGFYDSEGNKLSGGESGHKH